MCVLQGCWRERGNIKKDVRKGVEVFGTQGKVEDGQDKLGKS